MADDAQGASAVTPAAGQAGDAGSVSHGQVIASGKIEGGARVGLNGRLER